MVPSGVEGGGRFESGCQVRWVVWGGLDFNHLIGQASLTSSLHVRLSLSLVTCNRPISVSSTHRVIFYFIYISSEFLFWVEIIIFFF